MDKFEEFLREMVTTGTPLCTLFGGICGIILAVLLLTIGWWRTLIVVAFCLVGVFVCGVKCKKNLFHKIENAKMHSDEQESFMIPKEKPAKEENKPVEKENNGTEQND